MVSDSRDASNHDLKRKIISDDRCGDVQLSDDGQVDPRRARLKHENVSEEDNDDDTYLSESSDESSDDYLSESSDSESDVEDTSSETATDGSVSPVSSVTKSPDGGSVYSGSADCDPDHATAAHRHRRKSYLPIKSPNPEDPKFKGVTVQFRTQLHQNQVQLVLTAYFKLVYLSFIVSTVQLLCYEYNPKDQSDCEMVIFLSLIYTVCRSFI